MNDESVYLKLIYWFLSVFITDCMLEYHCFWNDIIFFCLDHSVMFLFCSLIQHFDIFLTPFEPDFPSRWMWNMWRRRSQFGGTLTTVNFQEIPRGPYVHWRGKLQNQNFIEFTYHNHQLVLILLVITVNKCRSKCLSGKVTSSVMEKNW